MRAPTLRLLVALSAAGCAAGPRLAIAPSPTPYADTAHIPRQRVKGLSEIYDMLETAVFDPAGRFFDPSRHVRRAAGRPREAQNLDSWDDVANSSWFEHRNDVAAMSTETIRRGPNRAEGPSSTGTLLITAPKRSGVTPGLRVRDERGDDYLIKFDPPDAPELASAAEAIATKLVYAAGYHTAEVSIYVFDPARLRLSPRATIRAPDGTERPMTDADVQRVLARAARLPDGRIRALASRWLSGRVGNFNWEGRRKSDPNDRVAHQHRRELRGFYVVSAWINHVDARQGNTFDQFVGDSTGYIRHMMQDVSSTLGSGSDRLQTPYDGAETTIDYPHIAVRALTLGLWQARWERLDGTAPHPSVGYYSARNFDPGGWMPLRPNAAFEERTNRDGYWGAKLVASFTDDQLRAAVSAAHYRDPAAEAAILRALIERRAATIRYWFSRVTPIERPRVDCEGGDLVVQFEDFGIRHGVAAVGETRYAARLEHRRAQVTRETEGTAEGMAEGMLRIARALPRDSFAPRRDEDRVARLSVRAIRSGRAQPPATIYLLYEPARGCYRAAGLAH